MLIGKYILYEANNKHLKFLAPYLLTGLSNKKAKDVS